MFKMQSSRPTGVKLYSLIMLDVPGVRKQSSRAYSSIRESLSSRTAWVILRAKCNVAVTNMIMLATMTRHFDVERCPQRLTWEMCITTMRNGAMLELGTHMNEMVVTVMSMQ